jgi:CelD/BcsL family acetyltransferase involved in cellulose biosynthesis
MTIATVRSPAAARMPLAAALDLGPGVWDELVERSGARNPFLTWAWHRACADAVPAEELDECEVVVLRSARGDLQALLPFRVRRERLWRVPVTAVGWAFGDLGCPDHLDLLAAPEADLDALVGALEQIPWVVIKLDNVADRATNVERLRAACERRGWIVRQKRLGRCPYIELPKSWEAYLTDMTAHRRAAIRRMERKLRREHDVVLTEYGKERVEEGLRHLQNLHTLRWEGGGTFSDPVVQRLHRRLAASLAEQGRLWLFTLDIDGTPAAAWYGFSLGLGDTVYHYQSGRDPRWDRERVGSLLLGLMIRRAIELGYRRFDFLRGEEPYKWQWTRIARPCYEVVVFRRDWRGAALGRLDRIALKLMGKVSGLIANLLPGWPAEFW